MEKQALVSGHFYCSRGVVLTNRVICLLQSGFTYFLNKWANQIAPAAWKFTYSEHVLTCFIDQAVVILPLLKHFGIDTDNLGYFVLDNALNNDTTLIELGKHMGFDPVKKRLRCIGHILNLITEAYLFRQDVSDF